MFPKLDYIKQLVEGLKFAANKRFLNLEKFAADAKAKLTALWSNRPDWNQHDPTALDYMLNRTHYTYYEEEFKWSLAHRVPLGAYQKTADRGVWTPIADGDMVRVVFDGVSYVCKAVYYPEKYTCLFGSSAAMQAAFGEAPIEFGSDEPFFGYGMCGNGVDPSSDWETYTIAFGFPPDGTVHSWEIYHTVKKVKQLDQKYVPNADWNAAEGETGHVKNRTHWVNADGTAHPLDLKFIPTLPVERVGLPTPSVGNKGALSVVEEDGEYRYAIDGRPVISVYYWWSSVTDGDIKNQAYKILQNYPIGVVTNGGGCSVDIEFPALIIPGAISRYYKDYCVIDANGDVWHGTWDMRYYDCPSPTRVGQTVKADDADANDTTPVKIGTDRKLYVNAIPNPATAEVGQVLKVTAVDESGKPTAWDAANLADLLTLTSPGGTKYQISVADDGTLTTVAVE